MRTLADIRLRDPFVLPVAAEGLYYLYGTNCDSPRGFMGFTGFSSRDLRTWDDGFPAFRAADDFWATKDFWAPEVHAHAGRFYLFATFKAQDRCRGTQILVADSPRGPFTPISAGPVTPGDCECLDGTLHIDDDSEPWIVYCHEWLQISDGAMCALRLTRDLTQGVGEPVTLFRASHAAWSVGSAKRSSERLDHITDGPYLHRASDGALLMLWSSFGTAGYAMGVARSSGDILGPWFQRERPLFARNGGHGMLFRTFAGELMLSLHTPNNSPLERPVFIPVTEQAGELALASELDGRALV